MLDLDQLQQEITEAESYLHKNNSMASISGREGGRRSFELRNNALDQSRWICSVIPTPFFPFRHLLPWHLLRSVSFGRYSDPFEREQLIQRLLSEREKNSSNSVRVGEKDSDSKDYLLFDKSSQDLPKNSISPTHDPSSLHDKNISPDFRSEPSSPMVFYASDILQQDPLRTVSSS